MSIRLSLISILIVLLSGGVASASCNQPSKPICASNDATYDDREAYQICQAEVESFHQEALGYIDCMKKELESTAKEIQSKIDKVSDKTNNLIKQFNCKSGSEEDC